MDRYNLLPENAHSRYLLVRVPSRIYAEFYDFCKNFLWKMFHYTQPEQFLHGHWGSYLEVNRLTAETIFSQASPMDSIWIHDYHFLMLPKMLRLPNDVPSSINLRIGLFLHSAFPTSEIFRCLPVRKDILFGMLHSDLVGFQTFDYARHFMRSCFRILGADQDVEGSPASITWGERRTSIGVHPIGITPERFLLPDVDNLSEEQKRREARLAEIVASYDERFHGLRIILGKDTLEDIKGISYKLLAIEKMLVDHPEWVGKIVYIQLSYPPSVRSSQNDLLLCNSSVHNPTLLTYTLTPSQEELLGQINDHITRINSRFGSLLYQPIQHFFRHVSLDELTALYRVADVGFVLPLRDGMNLTAHEFAVASFHKQSPLVLSEFAGSARLLPGAFLCNPFNTMQVANKLHAALSMDSEQKALAHLRLSTFIKSRTSAKYGARFLAALYTASQHSDISTRPPILDIPSFQNAYRASAKRRCFFLDYDGTLTPIVARPELAVPSEALLEVLRNLCADPQNLVTVISGRDCTSLEGWLGHIPNLVLSAEHGGFLRKNLHSGWQTGCLGDVDLSWHLPVEQLLQHYVGRTPGSWIEKKRYNLVWHYRASDPEFGAYQAKELLVHLRETISSKLPVEILSGKKTIEIRPIGIDKGTTVKQLLSQEDWDFAVAIGDDKTDEDMFHALPEKSTDHVFSIFVGTPATTSATFTVPSPEAVQQLLSALIL